MLLLLPEKKLRLRMRFKVTSVAESVLSRLTSARSSGSGLVKPSIPVAKPGMDFRKVGSPAGYFVPALHHERVGSGWAVFRTWQQLSGPDHLDHLLVGVSVVRLQAVAVNLPEQDSVGPDVGFSRELAVEDALWRHPAHWQEGLGLDPVVVDRVDVPGQAKV